MVHSDRRDLSPPLPSPPRPASVVAGRSVGAGTVGRSARVRGARARIVAPPEMRAEMLCPPDQMDNRLLAGVRVLMTEISGPGRGRVVVTSGEQPADGVSPPPADKLHRGWPRASSALRDAKGLISKRGAVNGSSKTIRMRL